MSGDDIINYDTTAAVAVGASDNHDYTVTAGKTLLLKQILITGSGKLKAEMQIETAASSNVFNTIAVLFNSTAEPNMYLGPVQDIQVGAGVRVRVIRTNRDNQAQRRPFYSKTIFRPHFLCERHFYPVLRHICSTNVYFA